jgi:hypothetical protein
LLSQPLVTVLLDPDADGAEGVEADTPALNGSA